jgi:hypothetical protein
MLTSSLSGCSTPFGITVVCTTSARPNQDFDATCSTPLGVTVVCTRVHGDPARRRPDRVTEFTEPPQQNLIMPTTDPLLDELLELTTT